jgi:hypothetical protein
MPMLDVYKFLEEKKKPTLPPGIVDLSSAPRVTIPVPPQKTPSLVPGTVPMLYTPALDKVRQLAPAPPVPDIQPTVQPIQPQADLMRSFRALEATTPTPEQQRVVEQLKTIAKPPAVDMVTGAAPSVKPPDVSGADLIRRRERERARAIMSGAPAVQPVDFSKAKAPAIKKAEKDTDKKTNWLSIVGRSLAAGTADVQTSYLNLARLIHRGAAELTDLILPDSVYKIENDPVVKKFEQAIDWQLRQAETIGKPLEELEGAKQLVSITLRIIPTVVSAALVAYVMPAALAAYGIPGGIVSGPAALTPTAKTVVQAFARNYPNIARMLPFGAQAVGGAALEAEKEGANYAQQVAVGVLTGMGEMATEAIPLEYALRAIKSLGVDNLVERGAKTLIQRYKDTGLNYLKGVVAETLEEVAMEPISGSIRKAVYAPDTPWTGEGGVVDPQAMLQAGYAGLAMSVMLGALGLPATARSHVMADRAIRQRNKNYNNLLQDISVQLRKDLSDIEAGLSSRDATPEQKNIADEFTKTVAPMLGAEQIVYNKILEQGGTRQEAQQIVEQINDVFAKQGLEFNIGNVVKYFGDVLGLTPTKPQTIEEIRQQLQVFQAEKASIAEREVRPAPTTDITVESTVYHPKTGEALTVVDASDPSLLTVRNQKGTEFKIGRKAVLTVPPAEKPVTSEPETKPAEKEPWEMTREEFISGVPKGFKYVADLGETIARYNPDGTITLTDAFFDHNEQTKKELLAHEKAHGIVKNVYANNENFWDLVNSGLFGKYDSDAMKFKGVPYALRNVEEILTQLVADLQIGVPKKFRDKYAVQYNIAQQILDGKEIDIRQAIQQALSEGKPVPPEVLKDYPELKPAAEEVKPAELTPVSSGKTVTAKTERGTAIETKYAVVEADSLVASHDTRLKENPDYPKELQPRDRTRMASELQINRIVQKLEPEFLGESPKVSEGAPIVGKDGIVESGNARIIALQRLYEQKHKNAELYKNWIKDNAEKFGIDKETLETAKNPVLVRIRQTDIDRVKFTQEANEQAVAAMSASEQAQADAKRLTGRLMEVFAPSETGEILTPANRQFVDAFFSEVVSEAEKGKYITKDGSISQEGVTRIRNAVFAKAYGDTGAIEKLAESTDVNVKNQINAMLIAAPRIMRIKDAIDKGELYNLDISPELAAAMNKLSYLRETGQTVDTYLWQMSFVEDLSPLAKEVLYVFDKHKRSSKRIASILQAYADSVELAGNPNQQTIFAQNAPSKEEIWTRAVRKVEGLDEEALQTTIFQSQGMGDKGAGQAGEKATAGTGKAEKKLDQVMTELDEEVDRAVGDTNIPIGQSIRIINNITKASPTATGTFSSADPEIDARVKASHGVKSPSTFSKIKELMGTLVRMASREYEHLPRGKEFAPVRFELLRLAKQKDVATTKTLKIIQGILVDFINDPKAYNHFEWKVLLNDLAEEAKAGHELPFGYTEEKLKTDIKRLDEALKDYPQVTRAIEKRRKVWDAIVDAYIEAQEAIGFKVEGKLTKKDYYRHMVLDYANQRRTPSGTGKKLRTPTGAFYLKHRKGSTLDINTNYLEAEYEVMAQMLYDIERSKVIKFINDEANIINDLKSKAKSTNHSNIMKHFEQMAKRMNEGKDPDKWVTAEDMYRRTLNKKQAMGFNRLAKMAEEGELPGGDDPKWSKAIDALASGEENEKTMEYLSWILKNHHDTEAARNAALIFRGIHEKDRYIRETLGNKFVTWEDIIPEGYTTWQPREGNVFFFADTISSQYAEEQLAKGMEIIGVPKNKIRQVLAVGRKFPEMVIREEIAMTLDNLTVDRPLNPVSDFFKRIMGAWKEYQLISPKKWAKYNIRNISGDAEPVYIGNPSTFTKVPRAAKELYHVYFGDGAMTKDMRDWFERGGMQSLLTVQEMGDVNQLRMFVNLMEKKGKITEIPTKVWQGYWKAARLSTNYREAILRYAAYLDYLEQIKAGKGKPKNFGASDPEEVMALKSDEDKAYWLSNDLLGAYDRVSVIGKWLREHIFPFWSFQELNFKRYIQFIKNAARDEKTAEMVGRTALSMVKTTIKRSPFIAYRIGKFLIKAVGVWAALDIYNKMRWPDEEKELPPDVRNTPHIVLGRDKNGEVLYFTRLGSLGDFLEWFGLEESPALVGDFLSGRKNLKEIVTEMAKGSANKVIQAVGPQYKIPAELIMGRKIFPDAFEPGMIRDRWYYVFQSLDLDEEYSAIMKLPRKPYKETLKNFLVYSQEPGQGAYYEILDLKREFQKKIGKASGFMSEISPKSQALYYLKLSIRYQDIEAMKKYAEEYISHGGTADDLATSLRNMHPLHGLNKVEKEAFIKWLDKEDKERLILAMEYYTNVIKGERIKPKEKEQEGGK